MRNLLYISASEQLLTNAKNIVLEEDKFLKNETIFSILPYNLSNERMWMDCQLPL